MALVMWRPTRRAPSIWDQMDQTIDALFPRTVTHTDFYEANWMPRVDISETKEDLVLAAEIPGIKKEDIQISVEDGVLTLKGERKYEEEENKEEKNYHRIERSYGTFCRSFRLPPSVDPGKVRASYKEGVLKVNLPKVEKARLREIPVQGEA